MRVSTKNHGQTIETQALALRDYAAHRGFVIIGEYGDEGISGSKDSRPALDRLMKDARARKFDLVIVARFDRFARSVSHLLRALEEATEHVHPRDRPAARGQSGSCRALDIQAETGRRSH